MTGHQQSVFRPDIEGLRAIAIGLVLVYHAGLTFVPGGFVGVDVFFVISGFLITSLLVREVDRTGRVSLVRFYARRAKRLLPAAATVLVVTAGLTMLLVVPSDQRAFGGDVVGAAAYVVNWRFAARAVDYLAEGGGESPVLHFWSLSVEEQFYFVWPFLVIIAVVLVRRLGWSIRRSMMVMLTLVAVPSFVYSVLHTAQSEQTAFFVTTTRMWELAVGAGVAIAAPRLALLGPRMAAGLSWVGIAAVAVAGLTFGASVPWPGAAAAVPVLGTAALIAAGLVHRGSIVERALGSRPMVWIGGLSYSLYLWHWPVLVFGEIAFDGLTTWQSVGLAVASVIPAYLSLRLIENPFRFSPRIAASNGLALAVGAALSLAAVAAGLAVMARAAAPSDGGRPEVVVVEVPPAPTASAAAPMGEVVFGPGSTLGAAALGTEPERSDAGIARDEYDTIIPAPAAAPDDVPIAYDQGCQTPETESEPSVCSVGDPDGDVHIAALGDSKMLQYYEALDVVGARRGWRLDFLTKSACASTDGSVRLRGEDYDNCNLFNENVDRILADDPPDVVLTTQTSLAIDGDWPNPVGGSQEAQGLVERWQRYIDAGIQVVVLLDYPRPPAGDDVYRCLEDNVGDARVCAFDRTEGLEASAAPEQLLALSAVPDARAVEVGDYTCPQELCAPVIGDVLVLRQGSHITNTYAMTLIPVLDARLAAVVDP